MRFEELNPYVRFFNKRISKLDYPKKLCAFDFRIFYIIEGSVEFEFNDISHKISHGGIITIPPGTPYRLKFENGQKAEYYIINFDFKSDKAHIKAKVPVEELCFNADCIFSIDCIEPFENVFVLHYGEVLKPLFDKMQDTRCSEKKELIIMNSALMKLAIYELLCLSKASLINDENQILIKKIKDFIDANIYSSINNVFVAERFGYHPYYLNEIFVKFENTTLHKYITNVKIKNIKEKLSLTSQSMTSIAFEFGFKDPSYFSAYFRKATGMTPVEFRKLLK
ncbi:MAG: AraC family transcriptional regulator [Ruminococcaceae bacterium]|nr:AraC family transcriptional regulator [Oscillospiraceae bacterium]